VPRPVSVRGVALALVVFDCSARLIFESLLLWSEFLKNEVKIDNIVTVANKSDLKPKISTDGVVKWCNDRNANSIETLAKKRFQIELPSRWSQPTAWEVSK
jgi:signal recognition particle receptor subunit beta